MPVTLSLSRVKKETNAAHLGGLDGLARGHAGLTALAVLLLGLGGLGGWRDGCVFLEFFFRAEGEQKRVSEFFERACGYPFLASPQSSCPTPLQGVIDMVFCDDENKKRSGRRKKKENMVESQIH